MVKEIVILRLENKGHKEADGFILILNNATNVCWYFYPPVMKLGF